MDVIGNFLTIIRNGIKASKPFVVAPHSIMRVEIAKILADEGFIKGVTVVQDELTNFKQIKVALKYVDGESVIHEITRISTPGRRMFTKVGNIKPVIGGLGVSILTTNRGLITNKKAKELSVGGEIICTVW
jgi:small subunit ribosomal protein S8